MKQTTTALKLAHSADRLLEEYYLQSEAIIHKAKSADRLLTLAETKKLMELATAIKQLDTTIDAGATMAILMRFLQYVDSTDHEFALRIIPFQNRYLRDELHLPISI